MTAASNGLTGEQRALALYTGGDLEAALDAFLLLAQQEPLVAKHRFNTALVLHKMRRDEEAVEHARVGLALNPDDIKAKRFLGMLVARLPFAEPATTPAEPASTPAEPATTPAESMKPAPNLPRVSTGAVEPPATGTSDAPTLKRVFPPPPVIPKVPGMLGNLKEEQDLDGTVTVPPGNTENHVVAGKPVTDLKALLARGTVDGGLVSFTNLHELDAYKASIQALVEKYLDKKFAAEGHLAPPAREAREARDVVPVEIPRAVNILDTEPGTTIHAPRGNVPHVTSWPGGIAPAPLVDGIPAIHGDVARQMQLLARYRGEVKARRSLHHERETMMNDARVEPLASTIARATTATGLLVPRARPFVDEGPREEIVAIPIDDDEDVLNDPGTPVIMPRQHPPGATMATPRETSHPAPARVDKKVQDIIELLAALSSKDGKDNEHVSRHLEQVKKVARDFYDDARYDATITILKAYIARFPDDLEANFNLGFAYREDGNYAKAEAVFKEIIEFYYDNAYAWHNLSLIYALGNEGPLELYSLQMARDFGYPVDYQRLSRLALTYEARNPFD